MNAPPSPGGRPFPTPSHLAYIALSLAALFWSGNFVAGRALRDSIDPLTLNSLRWSICLVLLIPLIAGDLRRHLGALRSEWLLIVGLGTSGLAVFHTCVYLGLRDTTAINALLITSLVPAGIMVGAVATGSGRPSAIQWLGAVVSLVGVGVIVTRGSVDVLLGLRFNSGDLWILASNAAWVVYSLLLRRVPKTLPLDVTLAASAAVAVALLIPATLLFVPEISLGFTLPVWGAIAYIGVFASLLAFRFWSYGVRHIGPERSGQFVHLMPLFGAVLAVALLGETVATPQLSGAALVLVGILLVNRKARHEPS